MPKIGRKTYHRAMEEILGQMGYEYESPKIGAFVVKKGARKIYIDRIENRAAEIGAESWIAFCYAILQKDYERHFRTTANVNGVTFGVKLIKTAEYRKNTFYIQLREIVGLSEDESYLLEMTSK